MPAKTEPNYVHLRVWDSDEECFSEYGGVTLAYVRQGNWYKVGAAFCSLKDKYRRHTPTIRHKVKPALWAQNRDGDWEEVKPAVWHEAPGQCVGAELAKVRLKIAPIWLHTIDWHNDGWNCIAHRMATVAGRAWLDHADRSGLGEWWELRPKGRVNRCIDCPARSDCYLSAYHNQMANEYTPMPVCDPPDDNSATEPVNADSKTKWILPDDY